MNILLIQADQLRRDMLGVYGNKTARTPAIDRLASEGVVFDYAFTPTPICAPARASLITGKRPLNHGILVNCESGLAAGKDFTGNQATVAQLLSERGYRSTLCGKWHVGTDLTPQDCGFEGVFYPRYGYPDQHPHYQAYLKKLGVEFKLRDQMWSRRPDGSPKYCMSAVQDGPEEATVPYYLTTQAIDAVKRAAETNTPFFIRLDFWGPHVPYIVTERYAKMYDPSDIQPWPNATDDLAGKPEIQSVYKRYWGIEDFTWDEWARLVAMCYGEIALMDDQIARLRTALAELGVADDTALFFTSDHGGMTGAHSLEDKGPYLYDEICRIPLIGYMPNSPGGKRSNALTYNMDLMPTILDLTGVNTPDDLDAVSLAPILRGERKSVRDENEPVYVEFHGHQAPYEQRMIRTRTAKYIFNVPDVDELYDLQNDPYELNNVVGAPAYVALLAEMRQILRRLLVETHDPLLTFFEGSRLPGTEDSPIRHSATGRIDWCRGEASAQ
ncbi:MAG: sulfatase-like hydrolase/transferase [Armatimonadota bacterium]|nr:sulfatase-like hydrolase/transferase [Armatimonadota bacterium]